MIGPGSDNDNAEKWTPNDPPNYPWLIWVYRLYPARRKWLFPQHLPSSSNGVNHDNLAYGADDEIIMKLFCWSKWQWQRLPHVWCLMFRRRWRSFRRGLTCSEEGLQWIIDRAPKLWFALHQKLCLYLILYPPVCTLLQWYFCIISWSTKFCKCSVISCWPVRNHPLP